MTYRFDATTVRTTAGQAWRGRHGVCQDMAHVMIAMCRARGLAARYVSGHLVGEAYVDDTKLFSGEVPGIEVTPTLEMPGLRARVQGKRGLFRRRWITGRAMQLGATAARLTKDGIDIPRETTRSTIYRHDKQWLLVR